MGLAPLVGAAILGFLFVRAALDLADPDVSYTGSSILGLGTPLAIGLFFLILGVGLVVLWRLGGHERFFSRRPFEAVQPEAADG